MQCGDAVQYTVDVCVTVCLFLFIVRQWRVAVGRCKFLRIIAEILYSSLSYSTLSHNRLSFDLLHVRSASYVSLQLKQILVGVWLLIGGSC